MVFEEEGLKVKKMVRRWIGVYGSIDPV